MTRGSFLARVSLLSLTVLIFLQVAGCVDMRFRAGRQPKIEVLDQYLRVGESTREDVLAALGLPHGKGRAMLPQMLLFPRMQAKLKTGQIVASTRTLWSYYYEEGAIGEGADARRIFLYVFLDQDRYEGYMWFSSLPVAALEVKLTEGEQWGLARAPTDNMDAYGYVLRGLAYSGRTTKETTAQARQMFQRAVELDPEYAGAWALLGFTHWVDWIFQWSPGPESLARAFELAQRAIVLDDSLPVAHMVLGQVYLWQKQHEQAIAELERAIVLDPNFAPGYAWLGFILNFSGRPEEAIGLVEKALRLDPHDLFFNLYCLGFAYTLTSRYEEAMATLKRAVTRNPDFLPTHTELAVLYSELNRKQDARAEAAEVLRLNPKFSLELWAKALPFKDPPVLERRLDTLRKAGLK